MGVLRVRTTTLHFLQAVGFSQTPLIFDTIQALSQCREERLLASLCLPICLSVYLSVLNKSVLT